MKTLDWNKASTEERNAACAAFMPPSDINPIRSYYLTVAGKLWQQLAVQSLDDARSCLRIARDNPHNWRRIMPELHWDRRGDLDVKEVCHHARYSDTPGGAWMLVEKLVAETWVVTIGCDGDWCRARAAREGKIFDYRFAKPMPEVAAIVFLIVNGVEVQSV